MSHPTFYSLLSVLYLKGLIRWLCAQGKEVLLQTYFNLRQQVMGLFSFYIPIKEHNSIYYTMGVFFFFFFFFWFAVLDLHSWRILVWIYAWCLRTNITYSRVVPTIGGWSMLAHARPTNLKTEQVARSLQSSDNKLWNCRFLCSCYAIQSRGMSHVARSLVFNMRERPALGPVAFHGCWTGWTTAWNRPWLMLVDKESFGNGRVKGPVKY